MPLPQWFKWFEKVMKILTGTSCIFFSDFRKWNQEYRACSLPIYLLAILLPCCTWSLPMLVDLKHCIRSRIRVEDVKYNTTVYTEDNSEGPIIF